MFNPFFYDKAFCCFKSFKRSCSKCGTMKCKGQIRLSSWPLHAHKSNLFVVPILSKKRPTKSVLLSGVGNMAS